MKMKLIKVVNKQDSKNWSSFRKHNKSFGVRKTKKKDYDPSDEEMKEAQKWWGKLQDNFNGACDKASKAVKSSGRDIERCLNDVTKIFDIAEDEGGDLENLLNDSRGKRSFADVKKELKALREIIEDFFNEYGE